jgi:hypothetical protein
LIDLGHDYRHWSVEQRDIGPTISIEEVAADKTLALLARAEPRDFVDVFALSELLGMDRLCECAAQKDLDFSRRFLAESMAKMNGLRRELFEVDDDKLDRMKDWAFHARARLLEQARRIEREQGIRYERDRGHGVDL